MELNREQIIKALECCGGIINDCRECPIDEKKKDDCECGTFLAQNALSLINELTEENENAREKNKWLNKENKRLIEDNHILATDFKDKVKADTVRKMQERLKRELLQYDDYDELYVKTVRDCIEYVAQDLIKEESP